MRILVTKPILDYENEKIKTEDGKTLIVRDALSLAINNLAPDEVLKAEDKSKIYMLSIKLFKSKEVDLTTDDRVFIRERAGKVLGSALIYGRICDILFPEDGKDKKEDK
jgi:hypothetical protein